MSLHFVDTNSDPFFMVTNCELLFFCFSGFFSFSQKLPQSEHFSWQFRLTDLLADGRTGESQADDRPGR